MRWARKNLPRLTQDTIDQAEALIVAKYTEEADAQIPLEREPSSRARVPHLPVSKTSAATMTVQQGSDLAGSSPVQRRTRKARKRVLIEDVSPQVPEEDSQQPEEHSEVESPLHHSTQLLDLEKLLQAPFKVEKTELPKRRRALIHQEPTSQDQEYRDNLNHFTSSEPEPGRLRVKRHPNTPRKQSERILEVSEKWQWRGDSHPRSLPQHTYKDWQRDSFPGSRFRHAQSLTRY